MLKVMAGSQFRGVFTKTFALIFTLTLIASLFSGTFDSIPAAVVSASMLSLVLSIPFSAIAYALTRLRRVKTRKLDFKDTKDRINNEIRFDQPYDSYYEILDPEELGFLRSDTPVVTKKVGDLVMCNQTLSKTQTIKIDFEEAKSKAFSAPHFYIGEYIPKYTNVQDEFSRLILYSKITVI